ncbi:protein NATD1 isoform X3 [Tamandua tetradactyla]|uniref:protein NATD1 isoform X3 n=1 Tax=Tamandua tetradactyla TaxID=48850 RepID=UPI0040548DFF
MNSGCHDRAILLYEYVGKRIVDLQHTEVPDAYRGRGIAKHLAKHGVPRLSVLARGSEELHPFYCWILSHCVYVTRCCSSLRGLAGTWVVSILWQL